MPVEDYLTLADWRRRIAEIYAEIRRTPDPLDAWTRWREARDRLFREHPQSPLPPESREGFEGTPYFEYDPRARVLATVSGSEPQHFEIPTSGTSPMTFDRIGVATFELHGAAHELEIFWLDTYGGGLFLSFRDQTSGTETYGAGRYLLDTVKGADLGREGSRLILDFNFAYNPSCSYDARWVCPLAPPANHLSVAVRAGERVS